MNKNDIQNLRTIINDLLGKNKLSDDNRSYAHLGGISQFRSEDISAKIFSDYVPTKFNTSLLSFIRESFPICDRAIRLDKMLFGDFKFVFDDKNKQLESDFNNWKKECQVNYFERGLTNFLKQLLDSAREFGGGIGETIINTTLTDIACVRVGDVRKIRFANVKDSDELMILQSDTGKSIPFANQELIHYLGLDFRQGNPYGYPLFWGVPFVANIFSRILKCIENQVIRIGDPIFMIVLEAGENTKAGDAKEAIDSIKSNWLEAQKAKKMGKYADIFGVAPPGSVYNIKAIGADIEIFDLEIPTRTVLEQISLATDYPTFLLNLHMGDNYNITTHQNDLIVTKTNDMRQRTEPIIRSIADIKLALMRKTGIPYEIEWDTVNLQDEKITAEVKKLEAEALQIETDTRLSLLELALIDGESVSRWAIEKGLQKNVSNGDIERGILGYLEKSQYENQLKGSSLKLMRKIFNGIPKETRRITAGYIK